MRKFLVALALMVSVLVAVPAAPAQSADVYGCTNRWDRWEHKFKSSPRDVFVQYTIHYRWCRAKGGYSQFRNPPFAEPNYSVGTYNVLGVGHMSCNGVTRYLDGVTFNSHSWEPSTGRNYNPGAFTLPCNETTTESRVQDYDYGEVPRLYQRGFDSLSMPRWRVSVDHRKNFGHGFDQHTDHWQRFNP